MLVQKKYIPHMKALILSYFEPERQGRGIPMGAPRPHPFKKFISFLSEVMEAMWGWRSEKTMFYIKSPYLRIPKIMYFWIKCHKIMKKMVIWNASIWVGGPCTKELQKDKFCTFFLFSLKFLHISRYWFWKNWAI